MAEHPSKYESDLVLPDGSKLRLRPIRKSDTRAWVAFISRLSTHSKYLRFHHIIKRMGMEDAQRFCSVDYEGSFALVAESFREGGLDIIAIGRYNRLKRGDSAEFAVVVEDAFQGKGIGTRIMESLARIACESGIIEFESEVLSENYEMITLLKKCGFKVTARLESGVLHVTFPTRRA